MLFNTVYLIQWECEAAEGVWQGVPNLHCQHRYPIHMFTSKHSGQSAWIVASELWSSNGFVYFSMGVLHMPMAKSQPIKIHLRNALESFRKAKQSLRSVHLQ